jgi:hypothetical protein
MLSTLSLFYLSGDIFVSTQYGLLKCQVTRILGGNQTIASFTGEKLAGKWVRVKV